MKVASLRTLALAAVASLAMATSGSAITILQFDQVDAETDFVRAVASGSSTTLSTNSVEFAGSIPITIGNFLGAPADFDALETFEGVISTDSATTSGGQIRQTFRGTIRITALATGVDVLIATFDNAILSGSDFSGGLAGSEPSQQVTFTSDIPELQALLDANPNHAFALGFSDILPGLAINPQGTIADFTAENVGTFSANPAAVVPEPSGVVMAGTAMLVSLGCFGWRRRQSSRA